jgi:hypothetical protein
LAEASLHQNQGCGSLGKGFKKYGAYHAWYNATQRKKTPLEFAKEELLKLMQKIPNANKHFGRMLF